MYALLGGGLLYTCYFNSDSFNLCSGRHGVAVVTNSPLRSEFKFWPELMWEWELVVAFSSLQYRTF